MGIRGRSRSLYIQRRRKRFVRRPFGKRAYKRMWKKGRRNGNISRLFTVKKSLSSICVAEFNDDQINPIVFHLENEENDHRNMVGSSLENWFTYNECKDYKMLIIDSITTKLENFQVKRIISNDVTYKAGGKTDYFEDKEDILDPELYFYRQSDGGVYPTPLQPGSLDTTQAAELMQHKCIRGCRDGFSWTTKFKDKHQRTMVNKQGLIDYMSYPGSAHKWQEFLKAVGVEARTDKIPI